MAKYGMMQSGWLGNSLRDKYAGASTFDLAGGMDISFDFGKAGDDMQNPLASASFGLHFGNGGMQLHDGPGELSFGSVIKGFEQIGDWFKAPKQSQNTSANTHQPAEAVENKKSGVAGWSEEPIDAPDPEYDYSNMSIEELREAVAEQGGDSMSMQHKQILLSQIESMADGEARQDIVNQIMGYQSVSTHEGGSMANGIVLTNIFSTMQSITNKAMDYAGDNRLKRDITDPMNSALNQLGNSNGNWYGAMDTGMSLYGKAMDKATEVGIYRYGGLSSIVKNGSNANEFATMFERSIQHAGMVQNQNVVSYDINSDYGQDRMEEYNYFMGIKGYGNINNKLNHMDYIMTGEEGMGNGMKVGWVGDKKDYPGKDPMDDRIVLFKDGVITEFYRSSVDSTNYMSDNESATGYDGKDHFANIAPQASELKIKIRTYSKDVYSKKTGELTHKANDNKKLHNGWDYLAFELKSPSPIMEEINPYTKAKGTAQAVLIHANTTGSWNTSMACQVIFEEDYYKLIEKFGTYNSITHKMEFNKKNYEKQKGYYYLYTQ
ncbi:MAG: hypothetical protein HPY53_13355 [Brevinematales bacterium]|nr:hypothetical protein [Brevinematales bacterium]